jgi:hypothetical protein
VRNVSRPLSEVKISTPPRSRRPATGRRSEAIAPHSSA